MRKNPLIIAGPCVIEGETECLQVAEELSRIAEHVQVDLLYKSSFDKANRSDPASFRGVGILEGMRILRRVRDEFDLPVTTDIHEHWHAEIVSEICEVIQIPAMLSRQTDLIEAAKTTGRIVNVKIGTFMPHYDALKIPQKSGVNSWLTYRGTSYGGKVLVDLQMLHYLTDCGNTVVFDASHSAFDAMVSEHLAAAALAVGVDGLFFEVHPEPSKALCDGRTSVKLDKFEDTLKRLLDRRG